MRVLVSVVVASVFVLGVVACGGGNGGDDDDEAPAKTSVAVTLSEWEVAVEPAAVRTGEVTFNLDNTGTLAHDFVIVKSDLPAAELPLTDGAVDVSRLNLEGSTGPIAPGSGPTGSDGYSVTLSPGKYVLYCDIVIGTGAGAESHYRNGMYASFLVEP